MSPDTGGLLAGLGNFLALGSQAELRGASRGHLLPAQSQACGVGGAGGVQGPGRWWARGWPSSLWPLSSPVTCAHKVFPVSGPPRTPPLHVAGEAWGPGPLSSGGSPKGRAGGPGPSRPEAPPRAGLGAWGADASGASPGCLCSSWFPVNAAAPRARRRLARHCPPRPATQGLGGGRLLPGALAADSNKAVPQTLPWSLASVHTGPWADRRPVRLSWSQTLWSG